MNDQKLKQRRLLWDDLYWLIQQDKDIAEELIDEYVYLLDDNRQAEIRKLVDQELEHDYAWHLTPQAELSGHSW